MSLCILERLMDCLCWEDQLVSSVSQFGCSLSCVNRLYCNIKTHLKLNGKIRRY